MALPSDTLSDPTTIRLPTDAPLRMLASESGLSVCSVTGRLYSIDMDVSPPVVHPTATLQRPTADTALTSAVARSDLAAFGTSTGHILIYRNVSPHLRVMRLHVVSL